MGSFKKATEFGIKEVAMCDLKQTTYSFFDNKKK
jgi:hypothetical protein